MKVVDFRFGCSDKLWRELAIRCQEVIHHGTDAGRILAGSSVEEGTEVDGVDSINDLGNQGFFSGLADLELMLAFYPYSTSCGKLS